MDLGFVFTVALATLVVGLFTYVLYLTKGVEREPK
jgi:hypothetical protein